MNVRPRLGSNVFIINCLLHTFDLTEVKKNTLLPMETGGKNQKNNTAENVLDKIEKGSYTIDVARKDTIGFTM